MDKLVQLISGAPKTRINNDDDFADRLSSRYSVVLLVVFAILVGMNQYVRNPITCWAPVHFTGSHTKFTTSYCWVKNTYYLPWENEIPKVSREFIRSYYHRLVFCRTTSPSDRSLTFRFIELLTFIIDIYSFNSYHMWLTCRNHFGNVLYMSLDSLCRRTLCIRN